MSVPFYTCQRTVCIKMTVYIFTCVNKLTVYIFTCVNKWTVYVLVFICVNKWTVFTLTFVNELTMFSSNRFIFSCVKKLC